MHAHQLSQTLHDPFGDTRSRMPAVMGAWQSVTMPTTGDECAAAAASSIDNSYMRGYNVVDRH